MTEEIIIDVTKCDFNTFDGGGSQRTICTLDNCYCDGIRAKDCYFKELKRLEQENERLKAENEELKEKINYIFEDLSQNYNNFCDICCAKETCNGNCCYEQIKELLYETK